MKEYTMPPETEYESTYQSTYGPEDVSAVRRECDAAMQAAGEQAAELLDGARKAFCRFAREQPEVTALCCLGIGFVLGWKLKPW
jgi:hypothetical protein